MVQAQEQGHGYTVKKLLA